MSEQQQQGPEKKNSASPEEQNRIKQIVVSSAIVEVIQKNRSEIIRIAAGKLKQLGISLTQEDVAEMTCAGQPRGSADGSAKGNA